MTIAISDPTNVAAVDDVRFLCNRDVAVYIATESAIKGLLERTYNRSAGSIDTSYTSNLMSNDSLDVDGAGASVIEFGKEADVELDMERSGEKPVIRRRRKSPANASKKHSRSP